MILLERVTRGGCFVGVDDRAFHLHIVTRGVDLPEGLDERTRLILRGLLARDPLIRWSSREVSAWLRGETPEAPAESSQATVSGPTLPLAGRAYCDPAAFALAAASAASWDEARDLTLRGAVATWLSERAANPMAVAEVRRLCAESNLSDDHRHAVAMMALNPALPLAIRGEIVTPAWLLSNVDAAHEILECATPHLERLGRESWLTRLRARATSVREKAKLLAIDLDESQARVTALASSRANLEAEREAMRRVFPDTDHPGLASLMAKTRPSEEDLVLLISASSSQLTPLQTLVDLTHATASSVGVSVDRDILSRQLVEPRRDLFAALDARIAGLARCGIEAVDGWADAFRVERRTSLPKAATILAVPAERWKEPPRAAYVADLIQILERRISATVARGPLARFAIGKTTPRLDLDELGSGLRSAESVLGHILSRVAVPLDLDPSAWLGEPTRNARLRRLVSHADTFRRDTGIDGRYVAYPFLVHAPTNSSPRVMPVLLWPVSIQTDGIALTGASIMFDPDREDVRLNPALEGVLGPDAFSRYAKARDEVLSRSSLSPGDVMDVFGTLAEVRGRQLQPVPERDAAVGSGRSRLFPAAALFNAEFVGQNIAEDLRNLRRIPPTGTALEAALRVGDAATSAGPVGPVAEIDRFSTAAGDPSQDEAVLRSRVGPGLVVEGPPGTGKSQTIVNVITDAIGRGESVLIVCQKQAALTVVQKRLASEGLGERLFNLVDGVREREVVVRALRDQIDDKARLNRVSSIKRARQEKAGAIQKLEADLDVIHAALHLRPEGGDSYRDVLGELIAVEAEGQTPNVPRLRRVLAKAGRQEIARLEESCAPLAPEWLDSEFETTPLSALKRFPYDEATAEDLVGALAKFVEHETARSKLPASAFEIDDPPTYERWVAEAAATLLGMDDDERGWLAATFDLFASGAGSALLGELRDCLFAIEGRSDAGIDDAVCAGLTNLPDAILRERREDAMIATAPTSGLAKLSPARFLRRRLVARNLKELGLPQGGTAMEALRHALENETALRSLRPRFAKIEAELGLPAESNTRSLAALRSAAEATLAAFVSAHEAAKLVLACPAQGPAKTMVEKATRQALEELLCDIGKATERCLAARASRASLEVLSDWTEEEWRQRCERRIASGQATSDITSPVIADLPKLAAFQRFRSRAQSLDKLALEVFAALRGEQERLQGYPRGELADVVRRVIRREWLKRLKGAAEERYPDLLLDRDEVARRISKLAQLDKEMRDLNRQLLAADAPHSGTVAQWESVTRLRGPRAKRLREVFDEGRPLGLLRLRPVWLMSPDVASRILPLTAGLFDLAIFDEASQMPVEYAVPVLFRARRVLVAGDEKQMPPTSFFGGRLDVDEEEDEELGDSATEAERDAAEERWNRRDIQSCPDLLQLGRGVLPVVTLQIHYRSRFRELIAFSNAAFYKSALSVPARHPRNEVLRRRPIEVIRADGLYENQSNEAEALRVVEELEALWSGPMEHRPSVGVVTFNRKQADLVEDKLAKHAIENPSFNAALQQERGRRQDGEDMGFFVKNVENVQGDERDWIIFSTTFGFDRRGSFKRLFGVLGQVGGERRLNVAVTRAREKVVLITSMPTARVSDWLGSSRPPETPRDHLQAYLDYAARISSGELDLADGLCTRLGAGQPTRRVAEGEGLDGFERSVAAFVESLGHHPIAAPSSSDAFGLDFAIVDPATGLFGLGIECDAPRHPLLARARGREIWRREVFARAVSNVHRVSSRQWYENGDEERRRLAGAIEIAIGKRDAA